MDRTTLWKTVLGELQVSLSATSFKGWVREIELVKIEPVGDDRQMVTLGCKTAFHRENVENRYYGQIKAVLDRLTGKRNELIFTVVPKLETPMEMEKVGPLFAQVSQSDRSGAYERAVERA